MGITCRELDRACVQSCNARGAHVQCEAVSNRQVVSVVTSGSQPQLHIEITPAGKNMDTWVPAPEGLAGSAGASSEYRDSFRLLE